jgi:hypothetical protein
MHGRARRYALAASLTTAAAALSCTSTSTSVSAPTVDKCHVSATIQPSSFAASGGRGTIAIDTSRDCTWSVSANESWVALAGPQSGQGGATIDYTVSENRVPSQRAATIAIGSVRLQLSQAAAPCTYDLTPATVAVDANGGRESFSVTTLTGCGWNPQSSAGWIAIVAGQSGNASGTVTLQIAANDGAERSGSVTVGSQRFTVSQAGRSSAPSPPLPPAPEPPPGQQTVEFEGLVSARSGSCPQITFIVTPWTVTTNGGTDFKGGRCRDVSRGDRVKVRGITEDGSTVRAFRVEIKRDEDDDDDDD